MGNANNKKYNQQNYAIGCVSASRGSLDEFRPWSRVSRRSWSEGTLNDAFNSSKTAWPVPRFEAIFLPEFRVKEEPLKSEYLFVDIINKGSYGRVYKVQSINTKEIFALKVISKAKIVAENAVAQAKQEVAIQRAVGHHPFIASAPQHWQGRKTLYILMEYIGGGELYSLVEEYGRLPENVVRIYVSELALAIDFLHNAGIIHRDLKATNVLLDNEGHAVLIDFGLAKWLAPTHRTGTICGTPEYMAPEILRDEYYGHEADWWSLGVLTCFLLTNKYPAIGPTKVELPNYKKWGSNNSNSGNNRDVALPGTLPDGIDVSRAAEDLLKRLLQVNPRTRLRSILGLQRIAFYMGHDVRSYTLKKVSPFRLLGRSIRPQTVPRARMENDFSDFESFVGSTAGTEYR